MISYWGVEHGDVAKSYLPSTGWRPVTQMTTKQRTLLKNRAFNHRTVRRSIDESGARITGFRTRTRSGKKVVQSVALGSHRNLNGDQPINQGFLRREVGLRVKRKGYNVASNLQLTTAPVDPVKRVLNTKLGAPMERSGSLHDATGTKRGLSGTKKDKSRRG